MPAARKTPAKPAAPRNADLTKALDALNDAIGRAQSAAKSVREDLAGSTLPRDLVGNVERLMRDVRRDAAKLDKAVRADIRKAVSGAKKPAAKKPAAAAKKPAAAVKKVAAAAKKPAAAAAKKPAAKKPAAKKPAARKPAAKAVAAKKPAAAAKKPVAKKPAARKPAARKPAAKKPAAK